jgi:hypothetical protein
MNKNKFVIIDWCSNICFKGREFDSFEDAWGFLYELYDEQKFAGTLSEKEFDDQMSEYSVVNTKSKKYQNCNWRI